MSKGKIVPTRTYCTIIEASDVSVSHKQTEHDRKLLVRGAMLGAVTAVLAHVSFPVPFSPVPITGQSFGAMLAGLLLSPRAAAGSQLAYLAAGALGLPVYAGGRAGLGVLLGPTGGYIWGMAAGAYVSSSIVRMYISRGTRLRWNLAAAASAIGGVAVVYVLGVIQLSLATQLPITRAIAVGALPYLPGDLLKAAFAGVIGSRLASYRL